MPPYARNPIRALAKVALDGVIESLGNEYVGGR